MIIKNANEDVVKMIIGNKCDMEDKRVVSSDKGQEVSGKVFIYRDLAMNFHIQEQKNS